MSRVHRFFTNNSFELRHSFWLHDAALLHQWNKVLRYQAGQEVLLFDGVASDRLYKILEISATEAHLELITDYHRTMPSADVYLLWSLLKKDKNDWVLQKATELGVSHFVPILAERSEKTSFDIDRAQKIVVEASEQCGRSDIPALREPQLLKTAIEHMSESTTLVVCDQGDHGTVSPVGPTGYLVGPEGGWSGHERALFESHGLQHFGLSAFTLRAETAAVVAAAFAAR